MKEWELKPTPGSHPPSKAGSFFLDILMKRVLFPFNRNLRSFQKTEASLRTEKCSEHVGAFREFLKANGKTVEEQELVAAKMMGRWRKTGAPLVYVLIKMIVNLDLMTKEITILITKRWTLMVMHAR